MNHAFEEHFIGYILKFLFFPNKRPLYVYNQKISFNPTVVSIARLDSVFSGKFTGNKYIHITYEVNDMSEIIKSDCSVQVVQAYLSALANLYSRISTTLLIL